MRIRGKFTTKL